MANPQAPTPNSPLMIGPLENQRHELFCQHLVAGKLTQADAYRQAGFKGSDKSNEANAARLMANDKIAGRVAELREALFDRYEVANDRVIRELALSAFARMKDYAKLLNTGSLDDVTTEQSAAIGELTRDLIDGGDKKPSVTRIRLKLADKHQSLVALAKIKGLMKEGGSEPMVVNFTIHRTERSAKRD